MIQHLPILAIMTYFLCAFLTTLFGHNNKAVRWFLVLLSAEVRFLLPENLSFQNAMYMLKKYWQY